MSRSESIRLFHPWLRAAAALGVAVAGLIACGGGGSSGSASSGANATSFAAGPITGFGSVIINGVRFDDSKAHIADDDGNAHVSGDLKLGMIAEVHGGALSTDDKGTHGAADDIAFRSEVVGPVGAVDATAGTLTVLGQPVDVSATTVFDDRLSTGLAAIKVGDVVEVYGLLDTATGHISATRIEPKPNAALFKVRGIVAALDTTAHTFQINGQTFSYAGLDPTLVPATLANGLLVRVKVQTTQTAGAWVVTQLRDATRKVEDRDEAEIKGRITAFTSSAAFSVDGIAVDASSATFPNGTTGVVLGARVEVEGKASGGVIVASKVSVETEDEARHGEFELHGQISALDTTAKTFSLRGLTVDYSGTGVVFKDGTAATLANGVQVEVRGALSADGTQVAASRIDFEH